MRRDLLSTSLAINRILLKPFLTKFDESSFTHFLKYLIRITYSSNPKGLPIDMEFHVLHASRMTRSHIYILPCICRFTDHISGYFLP